eukprot:6214510-Pleurochrysis_carterae.AAC.1
MNYSCNLLLAKATDVFGWHCPMVPANHIFKGRSQEGIATEKAIGQGAFNSCAPRLASSRRLASLADVMFEMPRTAACKCCVSSAAQSMCSKPGTLAACATHSKAGTT